MRRVAVLKSVQNTNELKMLLMNKVDIVYASTHNFNKDAAEFVPGRSAALGSYISNVIVDEESLVFDLTEADIMDNNVDRAWSPVEHNMRSPGSVCRRREPKDTCSAESLPIAPAIPLKSAVITSMDNEYDCSTQVKKHVTNLILDEDETTGYKRLCMGRGRGKLFKGVDGIIGKGAGEQDFPHHLADSEETWPQAGEIWKFNGKVDSVSIFEDAVGSVRIDGLCCKGGNTNRYYREVEVLEVASTELVLVRGTGNMTWLSGWIRAKDVSGRLIFDKAGCG